MTQDNHYLQCAEDILKALKKYLDNYPPGYCYHLINLQRYYNRKKAPTIVVALDHREQFKSELAQLLFRNFAPDRAIIWRHSKEQKLFSHLPFIKTQSPINDSTTLYICREGVCQKPITNLSEMIEAIHKL